MRLRFRKIEEDDLELIMRWRTSPEVTKYMYTDFEPDLEAQRRWFARVSRDENRRDWIIEVDGEDVGAVALVGIDRLNRRCDWQYHLGSVSVRGKGVGRSVELSVLRYVFEDLKLNKLCCEVFCWNELVIRLHEKYGSTIEGTRRQHIWKNGAFHDIVEMGILREDWEASLRERTDYTQAEIESEDGDG